MQLAYNQISQSSVYREDEVSVSLTVCGGTYGGGSETLIVSYQDKTGTVNAGAHPGSYNGQDAYNDMLVIDGIFNSKNRPVQAVAESIDIECKGLQECDRPCGQRERERG